MCKSALRYFNLILHITYQCESCFIRLGQFWVGNYVKLHSKSGVSIFIGFYLLVNSVVVA